MCQEYHEGVNGRCIWTSTFVFGTEVVTCLKNTRAVGRGLGKQQVGSIPTVLESHQVV